MTIKQLETNGELALGVFASAAAGAVYGAVQNGEFPKTWPEVQHILTAAGMAGAVGVWGWIKMRSPVQPQDPPKPQEVPNVKPVNS